MPIALAVPVAVVALCVYVFLIREAAYYVFESWLRLKECLGRASRQDLAPGLDFRAQERPRSTWLNHGYA